MTTLNDLKEIRQLLSEPARWTQGTMARSKSGELVTPRSDDACSWCMFGAVLKVCGTTLEAEGRACRVLEIFRRVVYWPQSIPSFNDEYGRKHEDILSAIDLAIELEVDQ